MRKGILFGTVLSVVLMLGAMACGGGGTASPTATPTKPSATPTKPAGGVTPIGEVVNVNQTENPYRFVPDTYTFEVGKTYTLSFEKAKEFHTFSVKDLTIKEASSVDILINLGETVQQVITPTKAGTYKLFCVPHEGLGMVGQVIVK